MLIISMFYVKHRRYSIKFKYQRLVRRGGRVVEGARLESVVYKS